MKNGKDNSASKDLLPSREELINHAKRLRGTHSKSWVTNVPNYLKLLEDKRRLGIYPLRAMRDSDLADYPNIDFMEIKSDQAAQAYLESMDDGQIFRLIKKIEEALESYAYRTIRNKIKDFKSEIDRYGYRNMYAIDPDAAIPTQRISGKRATANPEG